MEGAAKKQCRIFADPFDDGKAYLNELENRKGYKK
jgi:hypothetical protein